MILDLHTHSIKSDDAKARVENYCQWIRKREIPLDGFVLTEPVTPGDLVSVCVRTLRLEGRSKGSGGSKSSTGEAGRERMKPPRTWHESEATRGSAGAIRIS